MIKPNVCFDLLTKLFKIYLLQISCIYNTMEHVNDSRRYFILNIPIPNTNNYVPMGMFFDGQQARKDAEDFLQAVKQCRGDQYYFIFYFSFLLFFFCKDPIQYLDLFFL